MQRAWEDHYRAHNFFRMEPHESLPGFMSECNKRQFSKVLDLGCGTGADMLALAEKGFEVTGVDFSPSAASNAEDLLQSKSLPGKVFVDNIFDVVTTYLPNEFPAIMAINALEYTDYTSFQTALWEIARILDDKGLFLLVVSSQDTKVDLEIPEQLFFKQQQLTELLGKRFNILDFTRDKKQSYSILMEKKGGSNHVQ